MVVDLQATNFLPELNDLKVVVVGARKVGKSASVVRFLTNRFINEYCENTDMSCPGKVNVDGSTLSVNIQDTSDKGLRAASLEHSLRWADAIIFVYSITDKHSFETLKSNIATLVMKLQHENDICKSKITNIEDNNVQKTPPLLLLGNKSDLDFVRQVSQQDGYLLANKLQAQFFETSAREGWSQYIELNLDSSTRRTAGSNQTRSGSLNVRRSLSPQPYSMSCEGSMLMVPKVKRSSSFQGLRTQASSSTLASGKTDFSLTLPTQTSLTPPARNFGFMKRIKSPLIHRKSSKNEFMFNNNYKSSSPLINESSESLEIKSQITGDSFEGVKCHPLENQSIASNRRLSSCDDLVFDDTNDSFQSRNESPSFPMNLSVHMRKYREPFTNLLKKAHTNRMNSKARSSAHLKVGRVSPTNFIRSGFKRIRNLGSSSDGSKITNFANSMSTPRTDKMSHVIKGNVF